MEESRDSMAAFREETGIGGRGPMLPYILNTFISNGLISLLKRFVSTYVSWLCFVLESKVPASHMLYINFCVNEVSPLGDKAFACNPSVSQGQLKLSHYFLEKSVHVCSLRGPWGQIHTHHSTTHTHTTYILPIPHHTCTTLHIYHTHIHTSPHHTCITHIPHIHTHTPHHTYTTYT